MFHITKSDPIRDSNKNLLPPPPRKNLNKSNSYIHDVFIFTIAIRFFIVVQLLTIIPKGLNNSEKSTLRELLKQSRKVSCSSLKDEIPHFVWNDKKRCKNNRKRGWNDSPIMSI